MGEVLPEDDGSDIEGSIHVPITSKHHEKRTCWELKCAAQAEELKAAAEAYHAEREAREKAERTSRRADEAWHAICGADRPILKPLADLLLVIQGVGTGDPHMAAIDVARAESDLINRAQNAEAERDALRERVKLLREGLEYYADCETSWIEKTGGTARAALARADAEKEKTE